jgi:hypothetical protein
MTKSQGHAHPDYHMELFPRYRRDLEESPRSVLDGFGGPCSRARANRRERAPEKFK